RPPLVRGLGANGAAEHRIARLERIEHRALRGRARDVQLDLAVDVGEGPQMRRQHDADGHGSVCTSTATTAGRCSTIGFQLSPASGETYTCPPVVPKYTPQGSSASTAIASRRTLT